MPYFDHNATTPLSLSAREAWLRGADESWHNPSSPYRAAARARVRLDAERERLALLLGCDASSLVFNSGATEGANAVLRWWSETLPSGAFVAINPTEHPAVLESARLFFRDRLLYMPVTAEGLIQPAELSNVLGGVGQTPHGPVGGVIVMAANNETGVIQPWREIGALCGEARVAYLCDASQWLGKLPAAGLGELGWVIGSAHKFGGPKGTGFIKLASGSDGFCSSSGGGQERGHRGGTEDLPGISAMIAALAEAEQQKVFQETERTRWRARFERELQAAIPGVIINAAAADRLWNTVSLLMPHETSQRWVARLDKLGFQVSTGSACATGKDGPSHVLAALGVPQRAATRVVRISSGWETTEAEWLALLDAFIKADADLRATATPVINP